ncbi:hypothetical protein ACHAXS_014190 [Conticribra weissflogii]
MTISEKKGLGADISASSSQPAASIIARPQHLPPKKVKVATRERGPNKRDLDLQVSAVQAVRSRIFRTGASISLACQMEGIPEHLYEKWCKNPAVTLRMKETPTTISSCSFLAAAAARVAENERGQYCFPYSISPSESSLSADVDSETLQLPLASKSVRPPKLIDASFLSNNGIMIQVPPIASNAKTDMLDYAPNSIEERNRVSCSASIGVPSVGSGHTNVLKESHAHGEATEKATYHSTAKNTRAPSSSQSIFSSSPTTTREINNIRRKIGVIEWVHKSSISLSDALVDLSKHLEMMAALEANDDIDSGESARINNRKKIALLNRIRQRILPQMIRGIGNMRKVTDPSGKSMGYSSENASISNDVTTPASTRPFRRSSQDRFAPKTPCKSGSSKPPCDHDFRIAVQKHVVKPSTQHLHKSIDLPVGIETTRWYTPIQKVTKPTRFSKNAKKVIKYWHTPILKSLKPIQYHSAVQRKPIQNNNVTNQPTTYSRCSSNDPTKQTHLSRFIQLTHVTKTTYFHENTAKESDSTAPLQKISIHNVIHPTPLRKPIHKSLTIQTAFEPNSSNEKKRTNDLGDDNEGNSNKKLRLDTTNDRRILTQPCHEDSRHGLNSDSSIRTECQKRGNGMLNTLVLFQVDTKTGTGRVSPSSNNGSVIGMKAMFVGGMTENWAEDASTDDRVVSVKLAP